MVTLWAVILVGAAAIALGAISTVPAAASAATGSEVLAMGHDGQGELGIGFQSNIGTPQDLAGPALRPHPAFLHPLPAPGARRPRSRECGRAVLRPRALGLDLRGQRHERRLVVRAAHELHRAVSAPFRDRGYPLGHVTGHSIGMTMIEHPKVGEGVDVELREGMVLSMHPHAISQDGKACLYMQDTWLVTAGGGVCLDDLPLKIYDGSEKRS